VARMQATRWYWRNRAQLRPASASRTRSRHESNAGQGGFALVAVIWSLGLITLLGTALIVGARYRTKVTSSLASVTAATAAAESAINLAIMTAVTTTPAQKVKFPLRCRMPGGEKVIVTLEQEAGKVDLNTATPAVLTRLFTALTLDQSAATRITGRIVQFRDPGGNQPQDTAPPASDGKPDNGKIAGFTTIMQLDQIDGVSPRLFRTALRFVTVRSGRPEPVAEAASPALRKALGLDQNPVGADQGAQANGSVTIRADVSTPDGVRFVREALVSFSEDGRPYLIREWRHGDLDPGALPQRREGTGLTDDGCFRIGGATAS